MELQTIKLFVRKFNNISAHTLIFGLFLLITLASCKNKDLITVPENTTKNLVIVTDNDQASYMMIKILGKVRSNYPDIQITYLQSKQFNIFEGAFLLNTSLNSFPDGTVFAGIVEPGAGSQRLVYQVGSKRVLAPDNGLSTWILHDNPRTACYTVENPFVQGGANPAGLTYEEFYADALCSLISGRSLTDFGSLCSTPVAFTVQESKLDGNSILGQILFTDNFGNCITNITADLVKDIPAGTVFTLSSGSVQTKITLGTTYSSVSTGENVCFVNSSNFLELAINYGSFSEKFSLSSGAGFKLTK